MLNADFKSSPIAILFPDAITTFLNLGNESLSLIYFNYIGKEKENIGVIAQQVKEICPQIVYEDENSMFAVDYKFLSVIALKGVQLLTSKLMEQENDIKQIKELLKIK